MPHDTAGSRDDLVPSTTDEVAQTGPIFWEALPSGALLHDVPAWRAYTGQPEPLPPSGWLDSVVHPADRAAAVLAWAQGLQTGEPISFTHRLRAADGSYHPFLTQANPVRDAAGTLSHWQGVTCSLVGTLQAQDRLRWQTQAFTDNLDAIIMTDRDGRIIDWNPAAEATFGYQRSEVIGQTTALLHHPADAALPSGDMLAKLQPDGFWQGETDFVRKDGSPGRYTTYVTPLRDAQGEVVGALSMHRNSTTHTVRETHFEQLLAQERALRRDVEAALTTAQVAETKFRTLIDRNIIGVFIADADYVIEANDAFLAMLGYTQADVAARTIPWKDLTPPGWVAADDRASHELITQGACTPYEKVYRHKDGTPIPIILAGVLLEWQPLRIMGFALDITERKRYEHAAASHAAELEAVLDAMTDGVFVYDAQQRISRTNAAARALNPGTTQNAYLQASFADRITQFAIRDAHGYPLSAEESPVARIMRGERLMGADTTMHLPDGHEIALNTSGAPICTPDGQLAGAVIVTRDVTAQRALERRVHDALNALLTIAEALLQAPDFPQASGIDAVAERLAELTVRVLGCKRVSLHGVDQTTGRVAPLAIAGLSPELAGQFMAEQRALNQTLATTDADFLAQMRAGEPLVYDFTQPPLDATPSRFGGATIAILPMRIGSQFTGWLALDYAGTPHTYTPEELRLAGAVAQLLALVLERERLAEERTRAQAQVIALEDVNRRMDTFLGVASHELRTPLTSIKANMQIALRALDRFAHEQGLDARLGRAHDLLQRSDRYVTRLDRIVEDLLDITRIHAGTLALRVAPSNLVEVTQEIVAEQRQLWPERAIHVQVPDALPALMLDSERISQVITNLLTNALKYAPAETPIEVQVRHTDQLVRVAVTDHGPGLPPEEHPRIWERFHRAPGIEVQNGSGIGLGLGLFICQTIITAHGGQIGVHSQPGQGATFWFTVPLS